MSTTLENSKVSKLNRTKSDLCSFKIFHRQSPRSLKRCGNNNNLKLGKVWCRNQKRETSTCIFRNFKKFNWSHAYISLHRFFWNLSHILLCERPITQTPIFFAWLRKTKFGKFPPYQFHSWPPTPFPRKLLIMHFYACHLLQYRKAYFSATVKNLNQNGSSKFLFQMFFK